ncbi:MULTISPECIES: hypothetical protein [Clostridium]|uniref:hypothetical protein n=1 Tax=Clostridium sporogenes TaxID=1509 RepID=UPI0013D6481A|nr:hypothetical protein [Clostridium sporogenes]NFH40878.1 hypothetical protein [Clostridium sporogenes]
MFSDFRKAFKPTKQELTQHKKLLNKLIAQIPKKEDIKLINDKNIKCSHPFQHFIGDCTCCKSYIESPYTFVEGGQCKINKCNCGYGFTCNSFIIKNDYIK